MNQRSILLFAAATLFAATAHAHDCSGGAEGGMDATGNQCNEPVPAAARVAAPAAAKSAARSPNAQAGVKSAARAKDSTPSAGERLARATAQGR